MNNLIRVLALQSGLMGLAVDAQSLPVGIWEGSLTLHAQQAQPAEYKIKYSNSEELKITMYFMERAYVFEEPEWQDSELHFDLDFGSPPYTRKASINDEGSLAASCISGDDEEYREVELVIFVEQPDDDEEDVELAAQNPEINP